LYLGRKWHWLINNNNFWVDTETQKIKINIFFFLKSVLTPSPHLSVVLQALLKKNLNFFFLSGFFVFCFYLKCPAPIPCIFPRLKWRREGVTKLPQEKKHSFCFGQNLFWPNFQDKSIVWLTFLQNYDSKERSFLRLDGWDRLILVM